MRHIVVNATLNPRIIIGVYDHTAFELLPSTSLTTLGDVELYMKLELGF
jgi:hypothetical protein